MVDNAMNRQNKNSKEDENWSEHLTKEKILNDEKVGLGDVEKRRDLEIALKMLRNGEKDEKIIEYTEINPNELHSLKKSLK